MRASTTAMTCRERIYATLNGEEVDRFPVWLKMANRTWQSSQPEPYRSTDGAQLLGAAGCDLLLGCGGGAHCHTPHVQWTRTEQEGVRRTVMETPDGPIVGAETFDPYTETWHPTEFPADSPENMRRARWLFADSEYSVDPADAAAWTARKESLVAEDAFTMTTTGASPLMELIQRLCGPSNTVYLLHDEPELTREVIALMHADRLRNLQALLPHVAADSVWLMENTTTTLLSPELFDEFCVPHLQAYGQMIVDQGLVAVHHMCGKLNALMESIDRLPAQANEAYTTAPVGDTSLAEGRTRMPSKALIGGTNATLWLAPVGKIVATVADDLARCPDRRKVFLTSAGVLPPPVSLEKARRVTAELKRL